MITKDLINPIKQNHNSLKKSRWGKQTRATYSTYKRWNRWR